MNNLISALVAAAALGMAPPSEDLGFGTNISNHIQHENCHMLILGDSISNKNTNTPNQSSLYWGVIRTFRPDSWVGIVTPTNSQAATPTIYPSTNFVTISNHSLRPVDGIDYFSYNYNRFTTTPGPDFVWHSNQGDGLNIVGNRLSDGETWIDGPWYCCDNLTAKFILLSTPESPDFIRVEARRGSIAPFTSQVVDLRNDASLEAVSIILDSSTEEDPWFRLATHTGDESTLPNHLIWVGTMIEREDRHGFSIDSQSIGGARLRHHLSNGLFADDNYLSQYLEITRPTVIWIQLGANDGSFDSVWTNQYIELIERYNSLSPTPPLFILGVPYGTQNSISYVNALVAAEILYNIATNGTPNVSANRIGMINFPEIIGGPISQSLLVDNIHPTPNGSDVLAGYLWEAIIRNHMCPADLCGNMLDMPNGTADSEDFFFFLDAYTSGNLEVADLSSTSDANSAGYGVPDGILDAADFFYYLDLFMECQ